MGNLVKRDRKMSSLWLLSKQLLAGMLEISGLVCCCLLAKYTCRLMFLNVHGPSNMLQTWAFSLRLTLITRLLKLDFFFFFNAAALTHSESLYVAQLSMKPAETRPENMINSACVCKTAE